MERQTFTMTIYSIIQSVQIPVTVSGVYQYMVPEYNIMAKPHIALTS